MRPALRLLPLPLCIALSLNAQAADDMPPNWSLCPVQDVVKPFAEAQAIAPVVTVQNFYNIANRHDDDLLEQTAREGIAYVPYFPLGGFSPLQSDVLASVAARLEATPLAVAIAWLLQRSPNMLLIPGTSSVAHLRDNIAAAGLVLPADAVSELDAIG